MIRFFGTMGCHEGCPLVLNPTDGPSFLGSRRSRTSTFGQCRRSKRTTNILVRPNRDFVQVCDDILAAPSLSASSCVAGISSVGGRRPRRDAQPSDDPLPSTPNSRSNQRRPTANALLSKSCISTRAPSDPNNSHRITAPLGVRIDHGACS